MKPYRRFYRRTTRSPNRLVTTHIRATGEPREQRHLAQAGYEPVTLAALKQEHPAAYWAFRNRKNPQTAVAICYMADR